MRQAWRLVMASVAILVAASAQAAIVLHTTDFIPDANRTGFNGFEGIPNDGTLFTGGSGPYIEGGIQVQQVNGDPGNDIWVTFFSPEGSFGWYPNGGDFGFTRLTLTGGGDFDSVGLLVGTGFYVGSTLGYELRDNGVSVLTGILPSIPFGGAGSQYLGFSGGGFDEVLIRDAAGTSNPLPVTGGTQNALALDAIEIMQAARTAQPVPEPSSFILFAMASIAGAGYRFRRGKQAVTA